MKHSSDPIRVVDLHPYEYGISQRIPMDALEFGRETLVDHVWGDMEFRLRTAIAEQTLERHTFKAPLNWWEAVKERFAPAWFARRYPVRYRTETVTIKAAYPGITIPRHQHRLRMYVNDQPLLGSL